MLPIDLRGRRALVVGVSDGVGFGFQIARCLAQAGASVCLGSWPPVMTVFEQLLERGKLDEARRLSGGELFTPERLYAVDVGYDHFTDIPAEIVTDRRFVGRGDFSVDGLASQLIRDFGEQPLDILIHAVGNAPEVKRPLLETSRRGYLAALGNSAYSWVSLIARLGPHFRPASSATTLSYLAGERVVPGYGGGMSSAKAALESDTRTLAFEAGRRYGLRVNAVSAGPYRSRAAAAIGIIDDLIDYSRQNAPLPEDVSGEEVAASVAFLSSALASGITGTTLYVDKGLHAMARAVPAPAARADDRGSNPPPKQDAG